MTERVILESEVFMTDTKKNTLTILAVVLTIAVIFSACTSIFTAKAVYDLRAEAKAQTETQEDGVVILDQYEIVSTLPISEAYRSGNTNGLSAKDKETLELASAVLKEIITEDMTPYEKEKAVYDWMAKELSYDTGALQVVPQTSADCDNPYGTLKYHNAVCVGYATTFRLFMQMLDIPCMVVHNTERYHSWNLVQIEGNWYHVDIYSDQGVGSYANFNMNDELAAVSHDWDRDFFPAATSLEYNYAYQNRVSVKDIYQIPAMIRQAMEEKQGGLFLDFPSLDENGAQIVEAMISGVETALAESPRAPLSGCTGVGCRFQAVGMSWDSLSKVTTRRKPQRPRFPRRTSKRWSKPSMTPLEPTWIGKASRRAWTMAVEAASHLNSSPTARRNCSHEKQNPIACHRSARSPFSGRLRQRGQRHRHRQHEAAPTGHAGRRALPVGDRLYNRGRRRRQRDLFLCLRPSLRQGGKLPPVLLHHRQGRRDCPSSR